MKIRPLFNPRCSVFWATTYTFDIETFESYLLPRLGSAPLNAVVLADQNHLEADWRQLAATGELFQLGRAGRQYLLRGVEWPHRFHPKTYLFGRPDRGTLVVGSGNLGLDGLLNGNEVATQFSSQDPVGLMAIRRWAEWISRLVTEIDDPVCEEQWRNAQKALTWLGGPPGASPFVHNLDEALMTQVRRAVGENVDELFLLAPFCDPAAAAISALLHGLHPKRLHVYAPDGMAVDGPKLVQVLSGSGARVHVLRPDPPVSVHAKLVGVIRGDRGYLLSGSANLSQSALMRVGEKANCEAGVLIEATPAAIRELFERPDLHWTKIPLEGLGALTHDLPPEQAPPALRLLRASVDQRGLITCRFRTNLPTDRMRIGLWSSETENEIAAWVAVDPGPSGRLIATAEAGEDEVADVFAVCLIVGDERSGYVPLEEPAALRALLNAGDRRESDPDSFDLQDLHSPLGQLVLWIRERVDFSAVLEDVEATRTIAPAAAGMDEPNDAEGVVIEDLAELMRRRRHRGVTRRGDLRTIDDLLAEIRALRDQAPPVPYLPHILSQTDPKPVGEALTHATKSWTPDKRLQMRLGNALDRMCRAVGDLRIFDRDPEQCGRNIETLIEVIHACLLREELSDFLTPRRIPVLVERLLLSLGGTESSQGLVQKLTTTDLAELREAVPEESRLHLADLTTRVIVPGHQEGKERIYRLQPAIQVVSDNALMISADDEISRRLRQLLLFNDDEHWTAAIWRKWRVSVRIHGTRAGKWLLISPSMSILDSPEVVRTVYEWLVYTESGKWEGTTVRVATYDADNREGLGTTRLAITVGETAWLRTPGRSDGRSSEIITKPLIQRLISEQQPWSAVFGSVEGQATGPAA